MSHILITGGAGFIGSHLVERHLEKRDLVWVIDNVTTGAASNLPSHPRLRFDQCDVCTFSGLQEAVDGASRIYHMSATVGFFNVLSHPAETFSNNFQTLECILQALKRGNRKGHLLLASSSGVYWNAPTGLDRAFHEDIDLMIPSGKFLTESYSLSKIANEVQSLCYVHEYGIRCTIARIFNTIGIRQSAQYGMVVPRMIMQALNHEPITVFGDGHQTRSFCNVHDVVAALDALLDRPKTSGEIFNVGSDVECSILDLAHLILKLTKSPSLIKFTPYQEAYGVEFKDVLQRKPNIEKLHRFTGFRPRWSLEKTLNEIIGYLKTRPDFSQIFGENRRNGD